MRGAESIRHPFNPLRPVSPLGEREKDGKFNDSPTIIYGDYNEHIKALEYWAQLCETCNTDKIHNLGSGMEEPLDPDLLGVMIV